MSESFFGSDGPLIDGYDALLLDLDGTLHRGDAPIPDASDAVAGARGVGRRLAFVTNNASRTPAQVVTHLAGVGIVAAEAEVLTSAQVGVRALARLVPVGSAVLVVGGDGLWDAVEAEGLRPVSSMTDQPAGLVQGWFPGLAWPLLAEGAYALAQGLPWVATNADLTLPTSRGVAPGNGSFVEVLAQVSGRQPDLVAGKPGPHMLVEAAGTDGLRALVVGDRLDTDIRGAVAAGLDSLLVLTGLTDVDELLAAGPQDRPTYVSRTLSGLFEPHDPVVRDGDTWASGQHTVVRVDGRLSDSSPAASTVALLRAACAAMWEDADARRTTTVDQELVDRLHVLWAEVQD